MGLYFRVPLPGPFGYSKRIGGKRRRTPVQPSQGPVVTWNEMQILERGLRDGGYSLDWFRSQSHRQQRKIVRDMRRQVATQAR
jgi:hypothetical protein